jgi:hypothetical protein
MIEGRASFRVSFQREYPTLVKRTPRLDAREIQELAREFNGLAKIDDPNLRVIEKKQIPFLAGILFAQAVENRKLDLGQSFSIVELVRLYNVVATEHPLKAQVLDDVQAARWAADFDLIDQQPRLSTLSFSILSQHISILR